MIEVVRNPAELAQPYAQDLFVDGVFEEHQVSEKEQEVLSELEGVACDLGMINENYVVRTSLSYVIPDQKEYFGPINIKKFDHRIDFVGRLANYSTVRMYMYMPDGSRVIRSLCLAFDSAVIFPSEQEISHDKLLHVPAFAVEGITTIKEQQW